MRLVYTTLCYLDYLRKKKYRPLNILRVYSDHMERADCPIPGDAHTKRKRVRPDVKVAENLKSIALHRKIRSSSAHNRDFAERITHFENKFSDDNPPTDEEIEAHKKLIAKAEVSILSNLWSFII